MMVGTKDGNIRKIGFYEAERKPKTWQRYADIIIPVVTLPMIIIIALYLNYIIADREKNPEEHKWGVFALCSSLLIISFIVFVYICIRLSAILGGRTRLRLPMIRSNRSNACFLKSVNSDLQYMTPFNNHPYTYESIIFDVPPFDKPDPKNAYAKAKTCIVI